MVRHIWKNQTHVEKHYFNRYLTESCFLLQVNHFSSNILFCSISYHVCTPDVDVSRNYDLLSFYMIVCTNFIVYTACQFRLVIISMALCKPI